MNIFNNFIALQKNCFCEFNFLRRHFCKHSSFCWTQLFKTQVLFLWKTICTILWPALLSIGSLLLLVIKIRTVPRKSESITQLAKYFFKRLDLGWTFPKYPQGISIFNSIVIGVTHGGSNIFSSAANKL